MSFPKEAEIVFADKAVRDAFNRGRISQPTGVFDSKAVYEHSEAVMNRKTAGAGEINHNPADSSYDLSLSTAAGDRAVIQSSLYTPYIPGKSQLVLMTGVMSAGKLGLVQRIGYFDDDDGLFFESSGTVLYVVKRSSTQGTTEPEEIRIPINEWNIDSFDGAGPSGITLDFTKAQIFVIDFQWLGVGRIRFGFSVGGNLYYCHEIKNINSLNTTYMATPSLPVRYEILNATSTGSPSTLKAICQSVMSEGGYNPTAYEFLASNKVTVRSISARTPILAVRLKNSYNGKANRKTLFYQKFTTYAFGASVYFELVHISNPTSTTGTWASVSGESAAEYSTNITAITGGNAQIVDNAYVIAGSGQGNALPPNSITSRSPEAFRSHYSYISQNFDSDNSQIMAVYATPFSDTPSVSATLQWLELE